ncbi:MAG: ABC transporter permease [Flavobacteriales bacterium]
MEKQIENIRIAFNSIKGNKWRSLLTMLIIAFGITALMSILTATDALKRSINSNFSSVGAKSYTLSYRSRGPNFGGSRRKKFPVISFKEAEKFANRTKALAKTTLYFYASSGQTAKFNEVESSPNVTVMGIDANYFDVEGMPIEFGRGFSVEETKTALPLIILGQNIAKKLFIQAEKAVNKRVKIGSNSYTVVGVVEQRSEGMGFSVNNNAYLPTLIAKTNFRFSESSLRIKSKPHSHIAINQAIEESTLHFRNIRKRRPMEENNFVLENSNAMLKTLNDLLNSVGSVTSSIGILTLIGAMVALMNIMLVSVTERTREIGIRKSLGASSSLVMNQFLMEAIVISVLGGIFGILLGIAIGNIVALVLNSPFFVPWLYVFLAFVLCLLVGVVSGFYPAKKAASLQPVEALRFE